MMLDKPVADKYPRFVWGVVEGLRMVRREEMRGERPGHVYSGNAIVGNLFAIQEQIKAKNHKDNTST